MLSHVLVGSKAGGIFGGGEMGDQDGSNLFQTSTNNLDETADAPMDDAPMLPPDGTKRPSNSQQPGPNRATPAPKKAAANA